MVGKIKEIPIHLNNLSYSAFVGKGILSSLKNDKNFSNASKRIFVISATVYALHKSYIDEILSIYENTFHIVMDDSEENKNYLYAEPFFDAFLDFELDRSSVVVTLGGGVVGDFAGYLAAIFMRGLKFIHIPTTLLSMVDSSIGGKVAVNLAKGKNILGAFHQPVAVYSDISFLDTLPDDEWRNGLAEILKHGLIGELETLDLLSAKSFLEIKTDEIILKLISLSILFKGDVVSKDEKEGGLRAILNYGHTIGHAFESYMQYKKIFHGEAVALGMIGESYLSYLTKGITLEQFLFVKDLIDKFNLIRIDISFDYDKLLSHLKYDKKNRNGEIYFVLLKDIGKPEYNLKVSMEDVLISVKKIFEDK